MLTNLPYCQIVTVVIALDLNKKTPKWQSFRLRTCMLW